MNHETIIESVVEKGAVDTLIYGVGQTRLDSAVRVITHWAWLVESPYAANALEITLGTNSVTILTNEEPTEGPTDKPTFVALVDEAFLSLLCFV